MKDLEGIVQLSGKDYFIERKLGSGGEGVSYLAIRDDEKKVLKVAVDVNELEERLKPRLLLANSALNTRFRVHRHNIISVVVEGDYVEGVNLREHIDNIIRVYSEDEVVDFIKFMCNRWLSPLGSRGLVHRDIKPENIIQNETPNLIDFGSLKNVSGTMTLTTSVSGTPGYSRLFGEARVQDDFYSLARVASFLLTGKDPKFVGEEEYDKLESQKIVDALSVSDKLKNVLLRMQGVSEEYASPAEIVLDLEGRTNALVIARRKLPEYVTSPPEKLVNRRNDLVEYFNEHYQGCLPSAKPLSKEFKEELGLLLDAYGFENGVNVTRICVSGEYLLELKENLWQRSLKREPIRELVGVEFTDKNYFSYFFFEQGLEVIYSSDLSDISNKRRSNGTGAIDDLISIFHPRPSPIYSWDVSILRYALLYSPGFTYDDFSK